MTRQRKQRLAESKWTQASHQSIAESFLISHEQWKQLLPSQLSEQLSIIGTDGSMSLTELLDTLMQWYDTLSKKEKVRFWTMTLDFSTLPTQHGVPSRA
jgi:hypothetical protein